MTYTIEQALGFTNINLNGGNDTTRVNITGTVDVTALGTPNVTNVENGFLTGSTSDDDLTISGAQLDALVFGAGTIDFDTGSDVLNLTLTSVNLNTLGATDASIEGLETIDLTIATTNVTIDLNGQSENFTVIGSDLNTTNDNITTGSGDDNISGGRGGDVIDAGDGDDIIDGGNASDTIFGRAGDDVITDTGGSASTDTITGGTGVDDIDAGLGDDIINLANGDFEAGESIDGGDGTDELVLTNATTVDLQQEF